jgi:hypothetical protein
MKPATTIILTGAIILSFGAKLFNKPDEHQPIKAKQLSDLQFKTQKEENEKCQINPECYGKNFLSIESQVNCQMAIENKARYQYRWTDGWSKPKFIVFRWKTANKSVLTIAGGQLEVQNGFGAWQKMAYQCDILIDNDNVLDVQVSPLYG